MTNVIVGMTISIDGLVADASASSDRLYKHPPRACGSYLPASALRLPAASRP